MSKSISFQKKLEQLIRQREGESVSLDEKLTPKELARVWSTELIEYLKDNLKLYLDIEPCRNICGYDVTADVILGRTLLAHREDGV